MNRRRFENVKYELFHNPQMLFSLAFLILVMIVSLCIVFFNADPDAIDVTNKLKGSSPEHIFGTDEMGRDYFLRVLYGGRVTLLVGVLAMLCSLLIGVSIGTISGYFGGLLDSLLMRFLDVLCSIPWIIMVTVFGLLFRRGLASIIFVIALFSWMEIARLVRSEVLSVREKEYVRYGRFVGQKSSHIMLKHIIPSVFPTIITAATATIASAIMMESALSFLGLGVQPPTASWGNMLMDGKSVIETAPWLSVYPGLAILVTVLGYNLLGESLRDLSDPRLRR